MLISNHLCYQINLDLQFHPQGLIVAQLYRKFAVMSIHLKYVRRTFSISAFVSNYRYIAVEPRPESADVIKEKFSELSHIKVPVLIALTV